ncbi:hypothetical protein BU14_0976s0001 [Porphyra umbilicalis]|uniref:Uncharacterized protein n=1 Tax=Porphyra umbilicalis TaxID=2786 RepID=A0A1X6NN52_PORUM|nr:hypothetical protein BU14_0976s0001 [Porphyra umbilicalis]|eukprot:OSX69970.1 hypothetical protein BU14_0976s0001 [Porphyra umbilicalis]
MKCRGKEGAAASRVRGGGRRRAGFLLELLSLLCLPFFLWSRLWCVHAFCCAVVGDIWFPSRFYFCSCARKS